MDTELIISEIIEEIDGSRTITMVSVKDDAPGQGLTLTAKFPPGHTRADIRQRFRTIARDAWAVTERAKIDIGV